jgi:hypothetical protein
MKMKLIKVSLSLVAILFVFTLSFLGKNGFNQILLGAKHTPSGTDGGSKSKDSLALSNPEDARYGWRAFGPDVGESGKGIEGEVWVLCRWRKESYGLGNAFQGPLDFAKRPKLVFEARMDASHTRIWADLNRVTKVEGKDEPKVESIATTSTRKPEDISTEWKEYTFTFPDDFELSPGASSTDASQVDELTIVVGNPGTEVQEKFFLRNVQLEK